MAIAVTNNKLNMLIGNKYFHSRFSNWSIRRRGNNEHRCTGCTACELACPNGTIKVVTKFDITPEGKKKKAIDKLVYHLELCTMCNLCIIACPSDAIVMAQTFEHSVFDRAELTKILNNPGSKIMEGVE